MRKLFLTLSLFALSGCADKLVGPEAQAAAREYQGASRDIGPNGPMQPPPLILVNGVEQDTAALMKLDADRIESIEVFKGPKAIQLYGDRAEKGVIVILLKKK